jgi:hypothetical protein
LLLRPEVDYLVDRYSERKAAGAEETIDTIAQSIRSH